MFLPGWATPDNISSYGSGAPHLENQCNGALVTAVGGDFTDAVDVDLSDTQLSKLIATFERWSKRGIEVAMPVEEDDDPEVFHLWRNGKQSLVRVYNDDHDEDILHILDPLGDAGLQ